MICLLDTDHASILQRGGTASLILSQRLALVPPDDYGITIISYMEQTKGWLAQIARAKTSDAEIEALRLFYKNLEFYRGVSVWQYGPRAAREFETLRARKIRISTPDLKIAAIALAGGATVLTRNARDFSLVPGLSYEDWTIDMTP